MEGAAATVARHRQIKNPGITPFPLLNARQAGEL
ncbi:MAG: hypothetical protein ACI957_004410 [Verrucomicrobiales bacterium]